MRPDFHRSRRTSTPELPYPASLRRATATEATCAAAHNPERMAILSFLVEVERLDICWIHAGRQLPNHSGTPVAYVVKVKGRGGGEDVALHMFARSTEPRMKERWSKHDALSLAEIYGNENAARVPKEMTKGKRGPEDLTKKRVSLPRTRTWLVLREKLNYILWIQDLIDTTSDTYTDRYNPDRPVTGLDIGTGSSCIYPLLGCSLRPKWKFAAIDIDDRNYQYACQNVHRNSLQARILPFLTKPTDPLIPLDKLGLDSVDFTMCNPPFYTSVSELISSAAAKSHPPRSACTGAEVEMVTDGGEVAFVQLMIKESCQLKTDCQWYTSMLGKLSSLYTVLDTLKSVAVCNWAVKEFVQGTKTRRWAIAWSFQSARPTKDVARGIPGLPKKLLPFPSIFTFEAPHSLRDNLYEHLHKLFDNKDIEWRFDRATSTTRGWAQGNVWSRAARRNPRTVVEKMMDPTKAVGEAVAEKTQNEENEGPGGPKFIFMIQVYPGNASSRVLEVHVRWLAGLDTVVFESFCGFVKSKLGELEPDSNPK
ncbi:hypothetical protein MMC29_002162 [Sticta canariensis]|nr:hypothetical protein [Sticta canariensis]